MTEYRSLGARPDATRGTLAVEVRKGLASLFTGAGVLPGSSSPLVTGDSTFAYVVHAGAWVTSRGAADGAHLWGNDGAVTLSVDDTGASLAAPSAGLSRIDIVYALQRSDSENGDADSEAGLYVRKGTEGSPGIAPSLPTGALELARNTMQSTATDTAGSGNAITQTASVAQFVAAKPVSVSLTPAAGWGSGTVRVCKVGGVVYLDVSIQRGSRASTDTLVTLASQYRPLWDINDGAAGSPGGAAPVQAFVTTAGVVSFAWGSDFSSSSHIIRWSTSWPVGT